MDQFHQSLIETSLSKGDFFFQMKSLVLFSRGDNNEIEIFLKNISPEPIDLF